MHHDCGECIHWEGGLFKGNSNSSSIYPNSRNILIENLAITFRSSLTFAGDTRSLPKKEASERGAPIGSALVLPSNSKTWLERVSKGKPSSLLGLIVSDLGKRFYNIGTWPAKLTRTISRSYTIDIRLSRFPSQLLCLLILLLADYLQKILYGKLYYGHFKHPILFNFPLRNYHNYL